MAKYPNITLTNAGLSMIAESQGSGQLIFTAIKLGDGSLAAGEDIKVLAAVKNPLLTANISNIDTNTAGQTTLTAVISNAGVASGFFAREMGVYAKVGTDGVEKLYAYTNAGNYADYMPDKTAQINENQIKITLIVGNAANVTAIIDSSIVYPTKEVMTESISAAVKAHDEKADSHAPAFAAHNSDTTSHADIRAALKKAGGVPIGTITARLSKKPEAGELALDTGALVSRATYPDLWTWVQANAPLLSEADWQTQAAAQTSVGAYSTGDGATTFRLPRILDYVRGGLTSDVGIWQVDAFQGHNHQLKYASTGSGTPYGMVAGPSTINGPYTNGATHWIAKDMLNDGTNGDPRTAAETRPKTIKVLYCVKAFDAETNQGLIDITELANEMASKVNLTDYNTDHAKSLAANGYQKLPGGLILQWGKTDVVAANGSLAVVFPIVFPTAVLNITTSHVESSYTSEVVSTTCVKSGYTVSGFTLLQDTYSTSAVNELWFSIGY